jgi:hypothetical protein
VIEPKVAVLDAVRVQHGDYLKNEHLAQNAGCTAVAQKKLYDSFDEKGRRCFRRMYSCCEYYYRVILESKW